MNDTAIDALASLPSQSNQYPNSDSPWQEIKRRERDDRIAAARTKFLFPTPPDIERILEEFENHKPWNALAVEGVIADQLKSFPRRHTINLPDVLRGDHAAWAEKLSKLQEIILRPTGCIVGLIGTRGTGKTQIATALARYTAELAVCGHRALVGREVAAYTSLPDLLARVRATFAGERGGETEAGITGKLSRCRLLIIDEVHETSGTDWANAFFTGLVDRRYREMLDTILISNEQPEAFTRSVGPSIADRLRECGGFIACNWPSFRGDQP